MITRPRPVVTPRIAEVEPSIRRRRKDVVAGDLVRGIRRACQEVTLTRPSASDCSEKVVRVTFFSRGHREWAIVPMLAAVACGMLRSSARGFRGAEADSGRLSGLAQESSGLLFGVVCLLSRSFDGRLRGVQGVSDHVAETSVRSQGV